MKSKNVPSGESSRLLSFHLALVVPIDHRHDRLRHLNNISFVSSSFLKSLNSVKRIPTFLRVLSEASFKLARQRDPAAADTRLITRPFSDKFLKKNGTSCHPHPFSKRQNIP
jgi:hypothetical protein